MNEIINAIPEYVITVVASTTICFAFKYAQKLIHTKVLHAKTAQSKELWGFIEQVANTAVNSLVSKDLTGDAKFAQATSIVQETLKKQGFINVDVKAIESAVQSAYEKSELTPTVDPTLQEAQSTKPATIPAGQAPAIDPMKGEE